MPNNKYQDFVELVKDEWNFIEFNLSNLGNIEPTFCEHSAKISSILFDIIWANLEFQVILLQQLPNRLSNFDIG